MFSFSLFSFYIVQMTVTTHSYSSLLTEYRTAMWPHTHCLLTEYRTAMWPHTHCLLTQRVRSGMWAHSMFTDPVGTGMEFEHTQCLTKWVQEEDVSTPFVYWPHEYSKVMWAHTRCFTDQVSTGMRCERPGRSQSSSAGCASPPAVAGSWRPSDCPG